MTDENEPSDEQFDEALDRFRAEHGEEIDDARFREMLRSIWDHALTDSPAEVRAQLEEFGALPNTGFHTSSADEGGWILVRYGVDWDRAIPLGRFHRDAVTRPPQG
jgi:hypothetical protein